MPAWTLRLVAFAGLVALLGRLPALTSVPDAFLVGAGASAFALVAAYAPAALRTVRALRRGALTLTHRPDGPLTLRTVHGADA
jgi:hypothetical protein